MDQPVVSTRVWISPIGSVVAEVPAHVGDGEGLAPQYWWNQRGSCVEAPGQVTLRSRSPSTHWPRTPVPPWITQSLPHRRSASALEVWPAARHSGTRRERSPTTDS